VAHSIVGLTTEHPAAVPSAASPITLRAKPQPLLLPLSGGGSNDKLRGDETGVYSASMMPGLDGWYGLTIGSFD
jgi:hypothetical protein